MNTFVEKLAMPHVNKPVVGWIENYVPEEIIHAAGLQPFRIVGHREVHNKYEEYLSADFCSFAKNVIDAALSQKYGFLDGIIVTNTCTVMERLFDVWREYIGTPFVYMLEVPKKTDAQAILFFEGKLHEMMEAISSHFKTFISVDDLKNSIRVYNESRTILMELSDSRAQTHLPVATRDIVRIVQSASGGIGRNNACRESAALKKLLDSAQRERFAREVPRILITGGIIPGMEIADTISKCGGEVVYEDLCIGSRYYEDLVADGNDPVKALAERYARKITSGRSDSGFEKFNRISDKIDKFAVDGVICIWTSFCVSDIYDVTYVKKHLEKAGTPTLVIEFDHNSLNSEQHTMRIEAFLELLSERKKRCCL